MSDIRNHKRVINTFTGPAEKKVLLWLAGRMPAWVTPDVLTGIGVFGAFIVFLGYSLTNIHPAYLWLASLGFVINWFGDSLDGTVARFRHIERPTYGFYIDHVVDAYVTVLIFLGLGLSPFVRFNLAALALIGYMLLMILVFIRTAVRGEFTISYGKLGPTEVRLIAISGNTLVFFIGNPTLSLLNLNWTVYDWMVVGVIVLLGIICLSTSARQAQVLAELEGRRKPKARKKGARSAAHAGQVAHMVKDS
jgi:phosphatidylglycerophosphate synthase